MSEQVAHIYDGESIDNRHYTSPFIDLWLYRKDGNDLVFRNGIVCPGSAGHDFVEIVFEDATFKMPYNSIEVLDSRYTDWKKKLRVYRWSHRYESARFIPLSIDIEVDAVGRIVS